MLPDTFLHKNEERMIQNEKKSQETNGLKECRQ